LLNQHIVLALLKGECFHIPLLLFYPRLNPAGKNYIWWINAMVKTPEKSSNLILRLHPAQRLLIGLVLALVAFLLVQHIHHSALLKWMFVWDVFATAVLTTSWIVFFTRPVSKIREFARRDDSSLAVVFLIMILSSFSSLGALFLLFISVKAASVGKMLYLFTAVPAMMLSWAMLHTVFTSHYAHIYYDDSDEDENVHAGGLDFPGNKKPDYLDFAYFSFVIGMTFQVSDVQITSHKIRRLALLHGFMAFVINTFVVALTINLIAGLKS
jgi:uncharacterized membrane protein